jgi:hypothetical protein
VTYGDQEILLSQLWTKGYPTMYIQVRESEHGHPLRDTAGMDCFVHLNRLLFSI